jgi:hypothetical protein
VGGDTGGDGATSGSPGQWNEIEFMSGSSGTISYADVTYGGWGASSSNYAYAAVYTSTTTTVSIDHSHFSYNQRSGLRGGDSLTVSNSEFDHNGNGISIQTSYLSLSSSNIHDNSDTGLFVNDSSYSGTAPSIMSSTFANNTNYGINLQVDTATSVGSRPAGNYNNVYGNGTLQMKVLAPMPTADWTNNYWGANIGYELCDNPYGYFPYHLTNGAWNGSYSLVPNGPVTWNVYSWLDDQNHVQSCGMDRVEDYPYSPSMN